MNHQEFHFRNSPDHIGRNSRYCFQTDSKSTASTTNSVSIPGSSCRHNRKHLVYKVYLLSTPRSQSGFEGPRGMSVFILPSLSRDAALFFRAHFPHTLLNVFIVVCSGLLFPFELWMHANRLEKSEHCSGIFPASCTFLKLPAKVITQIVKANVRTVVRKKYLPYFETSEVRRVARIVRLFSEHMRGIIFGWHSICEWSN